MNLFREGIRVVVTEGEHKGRFGTVVTIPVDLAPFVPVTAAGMVRVALDGEPGQSRPGPDGIARGGRGGQTLEFAIAWIRASPDMRWFWIYGRLTPGEAKYDVHEIHLFPMPVSMTIIPTQDERFIENGTKQLLARNQIPSCNTNIWPSLETHWSVFDVGSSDPRRLARISGTRVTICKTCEQLEAQKK